ncbi:MAG TPA: hypothetical protein VN753_14940 [Terracidiphilus sp.]|nr:hypothetical protein [Terracidiphilus sp.]
MCSRIRAAACFSLFYAFLLSVSCAASPTNSKLLWLVPPGAQIVAGFENYHDPGHHGQLLLTTRNNRLDLADWQAIFGVDHKRISEEVIEVAASSVGGQLPEHLLLVAGSFDAAAILRSAQLNGSKRIDYEGQSVILVDPFTREKGVMTDTRWLIILDNRVVMFGTPSIVKEALHRYLSHSDIDMILRERLSQLPREVSSWNVLSSLPKAPTEFRATHRTSPWTKFFEGANVMMVGVHFGSKIHVHFSLRADENRGGGFFLEKFRSFAEVFAPERTGASRPPRVNKFEVASDGAQGSIELSKKQFDNWSDWTNNFGRRPAIPARPLSAGQ